MAHLHWLALSLVLPVLAGCVAVDPAGVDALGIIAWKGPSWQITVFAGEPVTFWIGDDLYDPASATTQPLLWDFGDGNFSEGNPVTHIYGKAGTYIVVASHEGESSSHGLRVDFRDTFQDEAPLNRPIAQNGLAVATYEFSLAGEPVFLQVEGRAQEMAGHTLHARLEDPQGTTIGEAGSVGWFAFTDEPAQAGRYTLSFWTEGVVSPLTVNGEVTAYY